MTNDVPEGTEVMFPRKSLEEEASHGSEAYAPRMPQDIKARVSVPLPHGHGETDSARGVQGRIQGLEECREGPGEGFCATVYLSTR